MPRTGAALFHIYLDGNNAQAIAATIVIVPTAPPAATGGLAVVSDLLNRGSSVYCH